MDPPDLRSPPDGCCFVERCPYAISECRESHPPFEAFHDGIESACYRAGEAESLRDRAQEVAWTREHNQPAG